MFIAICTILIIGIVLFVLSYFMNDRLEDLENQVEQFTISSIQDTYQLKKKIKVLEEELLPHELKSEPKNQNFTDHP